MKTKQTTHNPAQKSSSGKTAPTRGQATRDRILDAAKGVFSRHPYNAASIRMIAAEGGFEHGIIRYHFPSKAKLFDAVVREICEEIHIHNARWLEEVGTIPPTEGLAQYMDRLWKFNEEKPELLQVIALNLPQGDPPESIPGYSHIIDMLTSTRESLEQSLPRVKSPDLVLRFQDSFNALVLHYLGARASQARILGMPASSPQYREWVKATMVTLFAPLMEAIISGDNDTSV